MRTNIVLDDALVMRAAKLTGIKTRKALVHEALLTLIRLRERRSLLELDGKVKLAPRYDYKALRERG
jgi:Arc/MetJ family transcription regulator